jgi:hypothetical protein
LTEINYSVFWLNETLKIKKHQNCLGSEYLIFEEFNSFSEVKTPDDGQLGPEYIVSEEKK